MDWQVNEVYPLALLLSKIFKGLELDLYYALTDPTSLQVIVICQYLDQPDNDWDIALTRLDQAAIVIHEDATVGRWHIYGGNHGTKDIVFRVLL